MRNETNVIATRPATHTNTHSTLGRTSHALFLSFSLSVSVSFLLSEAALWQQQQQHIWQLLGFWLFGILALVAACAKTLLILIDLGLAIALHLLLYYCTCSLAVREDFTQGIAYWEHG